METPDSLHTFWFGSDPDEATAIARQSPLWWGKSAETDSAIRERFGPLLNRAAAGELDHWRATPRGLLALTLITDQLPRNIHRGSPRAFDCDPLARAWCREAIERGADLSSRPMERVFFYLPLEHSEELADQLEAIRLFRDLADSVDVPLRPAFDGFLDYAIRHHAVIERFGRFPHRNAILGRASTAEELEFLQQPGSSF